MELRYISVITFVATFLVLAASAQAVEVFDEDYNNLTNGALNGQNNWAAGGDMSITGAVTYEGAKALISELTVASQTAQRSIPHLITEARPNGTLSVYWRKDDAGQDEPQIWGMNGTTALFMIKYNQDYGLSARFGASIVNNISEGSPGSWVHVAVSWTNTTEYRICFNATTYNCTSGTNDQGNSGSMSVLKLVSNFEGSGPAASTYWDNIQIFDTFDLPALNDITITVPENTTYNTNRIELNVTNSTPIDTWIYRIDNITTNNTFTQNTTILMDIGDIGGHNITVFANETAGGAWITESISFTFRYVSIADEYHPSQTYETDVVNVWADLDVWNWTAVTSLDIDFIWNGTAQDVTMGFSNNYSAAVTIPQINTENTIVAYWNYTVFYSDGSSIEYNSSLFNIAVNFINLTTCSSGNVTLEFVGYNESDINLTTMNFVMGVAVKIGLNSKYFNFSFEGSNNYKICIAPGDEEYTADLDIEYRADNYPIRYYYARGETLTNETTVINLYLLHEDEVATETDFIIRDKNYKEQTNIVIQAQRYFPGLGSYNTVAMGLTGPNGRSSMALKENVYYKWLLQRDGTTLLLTTPETLSESPIIQYIDIEDRAAFFQYIGQLAYRCRDDTAAKNIICEYSAPATNLDLMTLTMGKRLLYNRTDDFCTESSTSPANTLICNYAAQENDTISWELQGKFSGSGTEYMALANGWIQPAVYLWGGPLGVVGILAAIGLFLLFAGAGMTSPKIAVIMSTVSIPISWLAGLHLLSIGTILGLCAAAGLLVYKMRD